MSSDEASSDEERPAPARPPPQYERRRRGAVAVSGDEPLTSKQHKDCQQAIFVSLGPKRSAPLLKLFNAVKTVQMAQQFISAYDSELGFLGRIQAATALSTSISKLQLNDSRMQGVATRRDSSSEASELSEKEKAAAAEAEAVRARQAANAKRRAALKALSPQDRAMLAAAEQNLAVAQDQLRAVEKRLAALAVEEADLLRQLESGQLTPKQQAAVQYRLEMLRAEKTRLVSQRKKLRSKIARITAHIETILAGNAALLRANGAVGGSAKAGGDHDSRKKRVAKVRNLYAGTRFDPGKFQQRLGETGLAFNNPLQCPSPPPEPRHFPGSALVVDRSPSAEERLNRHRKLLVSEAADRYADMQYNLPSAAVLRTIKASRRWERFMGALVRRHRLRALGFDRCLRLPEDAADLGQEVSSAESNAAQNVWCGTPRTHPFLGSNLGLPKYLAQRFDTEDHLHMELGSLICDITQQFTREPATADTENGSCHNVAELHTSRAGRYTLPGRTQSFSTTSLVPAAVAYTLWQKGLDQELGHTPGQVGSDIKRKRDKATLYTKRPQSARTHVVGVDAHLRDRVDPLATPTFQPSNEIDNSKVSTCSLEAEEAEEEEEKIWHTIEQQITAGVEERRLQKEHQSKALPTQAELFQIGGTSRTRKGARRVGSSAGLSSAAHPAHQSAPTHDGCRLQSRSVPTSCGIILLK